MKVAVVGSRGLYIRDLGQYLPPDTSEIVSGGAAGVDTSARDYAIAHGLRLTEFRPDYTRYGRSAPLRRNRQIVEYAESGASLLGRLFPWHPTCAGTLPHPVQTPPSLHPW